MTQIIEPVCRPEILAPAGDEACFFAAMAAGADAIYLGLKHFSARMQADNFGTMELARLVELAHSENVRVHVAMNTLVKPDDVSSAYNLVARLARDVHPDALIVQDLAFLDIARQAGFTGGLHLSTLANATHPAALLAAKELGASRVVLPRELSIDEMRVMAEQCPDDLELECFIHGALCYCVSGRCYWSSYMGGKSGLRGRCVQPCRRVYKQGGTIAEAAAAKYETPEEKKVRLREANRHERQGRESRAPQRRQHDERPRGKTHSGRYFSCLDLSLDVLSKTLTSIPHLQSWKIEGRKKGPHYVYHVVSAYRLLRDNPSDPQARKMAEGILAMALGRPSTHARFLPQKDNQTTAPNSTTSSGLMIGKVSITPEDGKAFIKPYIDLLAQDYLRVGVEDESWHATLSVTRHTPKAGTFALRVPAHKTPKAGTPVYLIDRREPQMMQILHEWRKRLERIKKREGRSVTSNVTLPAPLGGRKARMADIQVRSTLPQGRETRGSRNNLIGLWLSPKTVQGVSRTVMPRVSWWLPPVTWPEEEESLKRSVRQLWQSGARHFVCNDPWQIRFFPDSEERDIVAGPFCNIANGASIGQLHKLGFNAAVVSPELAAEDFLALPRQSPLPLGIVLAGFWPVGISRFGMEGVRPNEPFVSPKGEIFWARQYAGNVWLYPGWPLDLSSKRDELANAGYSFFVRIEENIPAGLPELRRNGLFNWDGALL